MEAPRWNIITPSQYEWERRGLDFIRTGLPDHDPYRAWANFEFQTADGAIYEIDLLVLTKLGFWLVECKAWSGRIWGDTGTWTRSQDSRMHSEDNPVLLANRKAKALASLLKVQPALAKVRLPWLDALVFLSAEDLQCELTGNARNRNVVRGRGRKAPVGDEPIKLDVRGGTLIEPGQTRWAAIEELLRQSGHLCWSSGDGRELILGTPNYNQAIQWSVFHPGEQSLRGKEGNALGFGVKRSTGDRYSRIVVVGTGSGTAANYGPAVVARYGEAKDNPLTPDGDGTTFSAPKRLVMVEDVGSRAEATSLAKREMARRALDAARITAQLPLHGQRSSTALTLFALDTLARVEDEVTGLRGTYLVEALTFSSSRDGGQRTKLEMIPKGSEVFL